MYANPMIRRTIWGIKDICFGILPKEIVSVSARKWNFERVIILHSDNLQYAQGVDNSKNIRAHILFPREC